MAVEPRSLLSWRVGLGRAPEWAKGVLNSVVGGVEGEEAVALSILYLLVSSLIQGSDFPKVLLYTSTLVLLAPEWPLACCQAPAKLQSVWSCVSGAKMPRLAF